MLTRMPSQRSQTPEGTKTSILQLLPSSRPERDFLNKHDSHMEIKQKAPMVDDDVTGWLIIDESIINFTGLGPLGVAAARGGDSVKRWGISLCILSHCTT